MKLHLIEATGEMKECRAGSPSTCPKVQHLSEEDRQIFHFDSNDRDSIKSAQELLTLRDRCSRESGRRGVAKDEEGEIFAGTPGTTSVQFRGDIGQEMTPEGKQFIERYYSTEQDTGEFVFKYHGSYSQI